MKIDQIMSMKTIRAKKEKTALRRLRGFPDVVGNRSPMISLHAEVSIDALICLNLPYLPDFPGMIIVCLFQMNQLALYSQIHEISYLPPHAFGTRYHSQCDSGYNMSRSSFRKKIGHGGKLNILQTGVVFKRRCILAINHPLRSTDSPLLVDRYT